MSSPGRVSRDRYSDQGSPAPRIRVGYTHQDEQASGRQPSHQGVLHHNKDAFQSLSKRSTTGSTSSSSSFFNRDHRLIPAIDQQLSNIAQLLTDAVLLPSDAPVDPALFLSLGNLELYDQDQRYCVQNLRDERKRLLDRRQAMELEFMRQETAEMQLRAEEKRLQHLETAAETATLAPENLAPMSTSRVKLLDDLGNILCKIRLLMENVHMQCQQDLGEQQTRRSWKGEEEATITATSIKSKATVGLDSFKRHGLMDLYDIDPIKCACLLRVEHARLAARRDDLELEYERQRTALLRTLH
ncbi:hypothetical protein EDD11_008176 [Mortierella claussenii]|nr:hypothetical protein EDD11_008176 [Mortierella claussenii]